MEAESTMPLSIPFLLPMIQRVPIVLPSFLTNPPNKDLDLPKDLTDLLWYTLAWAVLRAVLSRLVFQPLAEHLVPPTGGASSKRAATKASVSGIPIEVVEPHSSSSSVSPSATTLESRVRRNSTYSEKKHEYGATSGEYPSSKPRHPVDDRTKFMLSAWKFITYGVSTAIGLWIMFTEDWMLDPPKYWEIFHPGGGGHMTQLDKLYYKVGFSAYLYHSLAIYWEPRQKDFLVMCAHHVFTLALIFLSYVVPFYRVGCAILFLHDMSDPFMELAKMALYAGKTKLADGLFASFAFVFIATRNYIFPFYVIRGIFVDCYSLEATATRAFGPIAVRDVCVFCLCALEVFHIYWASLILKMAKRAVMDKGVSDDTRNED